MCEVSPTCVPTETAALFRIKEPPKSVLRYDVESRIITLKRKTKLTRIPTIRLPVTRLSSNFFITHHHPLSLSLLFRHFRSAFRITQLRLSFISIDRAQFFDNRWINLLLFRSIRCFTSYQLSRRSVKELKFYLSNLINWFN